MQMDIFSKKNLNLFRIPWCGFRTDVTAVHGISYFIKACKAWIKNSWWHTTCLSNTSRGEKSHASAWYMHQICAKYVYISIMEWDGWLHQHTVPEVNQKSRAREMLDSRVVTLKLWWVGAVQEPVSLFYHVFTSPRDSRVAIFTLET